MNAYGIAHMVAPSPVVWLAAAAVGGLGAQLWRRRRGHVLAATALGAVGFQVLHVTEHLLQLGYWMFHPQQPPWLTPWAVAGRDALAHVVGVAASGGNELLHLGGNVVFFAGLAALAVLAGRQGVAGQLDALRPAMYLQGGHVAEHLLLTATSLLTGRAVGMSTLFGVLAPPAPAATASRVLVHFVVNLVATAYALQAVRHARALELFPRRSPVNLLAHAPGIGTTASARLRSGSGG